MLPQLYQTVAFDRIHQSAEASGLRACRQMRAVACIPVTSKQFLLPVNRPLPYPSPAAGAGELQRGEPEQWGRVGKGNLSLLIHLLEFPLHALRPEASAD